MNSASASGGVQIGHLHGDRSAHFSFPKQVWRDLFAQGRVVHHPVFPGKEGPAARRIENEDDVRDVIALLRLNYDRVIERYGAPGGNLRTRRSRSRACTPRRPRRCRSPRRSTPGPSC